MGYHEGVAYCLKNKLMKANSDGMFCPEKEITRAELVEILWKIAKQPEVECELSFNDVLDTDEFVEQIPYPETKNYVKKVLRSYWVYGNIY